MGDIGIRVGDNSIIENVKVIQNAHDGILITVGGGLGKKIVAERNGGNGINADNASFFVMDSVLIFNGLAGQLGGLCSNIYSADNAIGTGCSGIAPNQCENPSECD